MARAQDGADVDRKQFAEWLAGELKTVLQVFRDLPEATPKTEEQRVMYANGLRTMALFLLEKVEDNEQWQGFRQLLSQSGFGETLKQLPKHQSKFELVKKSKGG